jgi:superoxide dismutase, Cu-Zn family
MRTKIPAALLATAVTAAFSAQADYKVDMNSIDIKGVGASIGTVTITAAPKGVTFTPDLKGLPPGEHGFHVHNVPNCSAKEKDGKMEAGEGAGPHYDPKKAGKHAGPAGEGHLGDLPKLVVAADGTAKTAVTAERLKLSDLANHSLMIHAGGDTYSEPPPSGGGGTRVACGIIESELGAGKKK